MTLKLSVPQGEPLSLLLSPDEERIYFENLLGTAPIYVQFAVHPEKHMLVIRRCTVRGHNAGMLEPAESGKGYRLDICRPVLKALYSHFGVQKTVPCRIRSIERVLRDDSAFLFNLKQAKPINSTADSDLSGRMMIYE